MIDERRRCESGVGITCFRNERESKFHLPQVFLTNREWELVLTYELLAAYLGQRFLMSFPGQL